MDRRRAAGKTNADLAHLSALSTALPRTKIGQIVWAWPQIQISLNSGRTMHEIWEALQLDGIEMSFGQFRTYVWRIRKKGVPTARSPMISAEGNASSSDVASSLASRSPTPAPRDVGLRDPLANIRESEAKRRGFDYRPELADPKELI